MNINGFPHWKNEDGHSLPGFVPASKLLDIISNGNLQKDSNIEDDNKIENENKEEKLKVNQICK